MNRLFYNFETERIHILHPEFVNLYFLFCFLILFVISLKKKEQAHFYLDRVQTNQIKGFAIFFVVIGHFWYYLADQQPSFIFGGDAVALFLICSGFGLTLSSVQQSFNRKQFLVRRLKRVMIPYWIATVAILSLDFFFLNKVYAPEDILLTMSGLNFTSSTQHIDYVRWYITFLIFWYLLFYFFMLQFKPFVGLCGLFFCAALFFVLDYYFFQFGWYQFFSFPLGCFIGYKYENFSAWIFRNRNNLKFYAVGLLSIVIIYKATAKTILTKYLPFILVTALSELSSLFFCFSIILIVSATGLRHRFFRLPNYIGSISYELFLLHGAFLVRYNFFLRPESNLLYLQLIYFTLFITACAILFQKVTNKISYAKI